MSKQSKNIVAAFDQLKSFLHELARLLSNADSLMKRAGWQPYWGVCATNHGSTSMKNPHKWLPWYFFRAYQSSDVPGIIAFVSVIVGDPEEEMTLDEAIITGGWVEYAKGSDLTNEWVYSIVRAHIWMTDRNEQGTLCTCDPRKEWDETTDALRSVSTFGYSLDEVASANDLKEKIDQRLVREIRNARE